jgi:hypothetical protein
MECKNDMIWFEVINYLTYAIYVFSFLICTYYLLSLLFFIVIYTKLSSFLWFLIF